jgi:hypothetical protein
MKANAERRPVQWRGHSTIEFDVRTHYCAAGNQPRMETDAIAGDPKEFDFSFAGITNLRYPINLP